MIRCEEVFRTICRYSDEEKAFILYAPELPGCTADGKTIEEAGDNLQDAIREWLEFQSELSRPAPKKLGSLELSGCEAMDVAHYILELTGPIATTMLQSLIYYSQVWTLAWFGKPLFNNSIEAWKGGPVCRDLFNLHRRATRTASTVFTSHRELSDSEKEIVTNVLGVYGELMPEELSKMACKESPWLDAIANEPMLKDCSMEISQQSMINFYSPFAHIKA